MAGVIIIELDFAQGFQKCIIHRAGDHREGDHDAWSHNHLTRFFQNKITLNNILEHS